MKIVVLDGYAVNPGDLSWDEFEKLGELVVYDRTTLSKIVERIGDAEAVFTNKTPFTKDIFAKCPDLKFVGVLATGYNVVDVAAAREAGVTVCNVPAYSTRSVAQMVFALLLEACHHVGMHSQEVKNGRWQRCKDYCFWDYPLIELSGKTMGVIGMGNIGSETAKLAQAFHMNVLAYTPHPKPSLESETLRFADLDEVLADSDVLSLHCPLNERTKGLINREKFEKVKRGVIFINTARGGLIVERDLVTALDEGRVSIAALDVLSEEPPKDGNLLIAHPHVIVTPHIAWAPMEARKRLMAVSAENLGRFIMGDPINVVS